MTDMDRAREIVAGLTTDEKISLLSGADFWTTVAMPEHGIPATSLSDGPHGLRHQDSDADHVGLGASDPATCFPTASAIGATWDPELAREIGAALGREARDLGVDVILGPGLNIKRHPAGGRNFEYFSEDPVVSGRMAAAMVNGIQSEGVGACLKHFAANNQEHDRMRSDSVVDQRTLREIYLTGFEIAVKESEPWTVMCSYNKVNGTHASQHRGLLTDILRDEWGFDGLVMSDWYAVADRAAGVHAGLDLEMPGSGGTWDGQVKRALAQGTLSAEDLDLAAARVVTLALRGQAGREQHQHDAPVDLDAHHTLARKAAAAGSVLLSNDGILPLADDASIALIGAFATAPRYQGAGSSQVNPARLDTAYASLQDRLGSRLTYAPGYDAVTGETDDALVAEARRAASSSDVVVLLLGLPGSYEAEGYDRDHLRLPHGHTRLLEEVLDANPDAVVALAGGAPIEVPWAARARAVLMAYLGGQASGSALADVLLGDAEPGGRLAESFPILGADLPSHGTFANHPTQALYRENLYVGYRFHDTWDTPARFPFGHGLGYTTFKVSHLRTSGRGAKRTVTVDVTNTGERAGSTVVQAYLHDVASSVPRPEQELASWKKVTLEPGETTSVSLMIDERAFAVYDVAAGSWAVEAGEFAIRVGLSSTDIRATATVRVSGGDEVRPVASPEGPVATAAEMSTLLGHPVPSPMPTLPFNRETTVRELKLSALGMGMRGIIRKVTEKELGAATEDDPVADNFYESTPLRVMAMGSSGAVSLRAVDAIIRTLNASTAKVRRARRTQRS
ncbi:glycoside hydrolase family 3 C-terminal domain-containing protein [Demequina zhanjiangensis]|uniref:Glycoside hydrolase family 3 C-terminal domain-containing protein n=1 Tax=Demequina zhanjiangensis TaxID=3051659 RepID=A0ABT8G0B8_9MICO|nr:glycoside hydrolase family 3 C-terminal domain-containing protein [Demequina sp. SYSU T00b26]MDN4472159.1 glycoside hydrolase family 3 C-terminal domain-containing protein [Demequina sp. SYSU T00b26]